MRTKIEFSALTDKYREAIWFRIVSRAVPEGECLVFKQHVNRNGYSRVSIKGVLQVAHRFIYQFHYGALDDLVEVDHLCHNRACLRLGHLRATDRSGNAKARRSHGFHHPSSTRSKRWKSTKG